MPATFSRGQAIKYLKKKGRLLPIHECLINANWRQVGMANCLISRKMPSGNFLIGMYLVDVFCLGMKNALYNVNLDLEEYESIKDKWSMQSDGPMESIDPHHFHNLIYGAIDFAEEYGFNPHKDFRIAEYLLDPDLLTDEIDEIEMGMDGEPFYVAGPFENESEIDRTLKTLEKTAGKGNFKFERQA